VKVNIVPFLNRSNSLGFRVLASLTGVFILFQFSFGSDPFTNPNQEIKPGTPATLRQMEPLGRGVVALHYEAGKVLVDWRLLGTDASNIGFNVYRKTEASKSSKLNSTPER
jgi:hypothetical protein